MLQMGENDDRVVTKEKEEGGDMEMDGLLGRMYLPPSYPPPPITPIDIFQRLPSLSTASNTTPSYGGGEEYHLKSQNFINLSNLRVLSRCGMLGSLSTLLTAKQ